MTPEPSEPASEPVFVEETIALARIEAIVANARATWLVLIGFLAFITVTLLSVRSLDFFSATSVTSLPIANIAIPTRDFFWTAAWLAAVLHTYFHLFLLKLWDALAEAPPRVGKIGAGRLKLGERVRPWLVSDWALRRRPDQAANRRPWDRRSDIVTAIVIWLATPLLLAGLWWRSMPAHNSILTLAIAGAFLISLFASLAGSRWARARLKAPGALYLEPRAFWELSPREWGISAIVAAALFAVSFARTGAIDVEAGLFDSRSLWLAPIDLAGAEIVEKPDDWVGRDTAERRFRVTWCRDRGLPPDACEPPTALFQEAARNEWCEDRAIVDCPAHFREIEQAFDDEWRETRLEYLANLAKSSLRDRDLRSADLRWAFLAGVDLNGARLDGADLRETRLEGADLRETRLERANLSGARLEGADFWDADLNAAILYRARLERANLNDAQLEWADLREARLEGTILFKAQLNRANLADARLEGANLENARLDGVRLDNARLEGAYLKGASFQSADWTNAIIGASPAPSADFSGGRNLKQSQLDQVIGNEQTILPLDAETGKQLHVWTCWATPPPIQYFWRADQSIVRRVPFPAKWVCPEGVSPKRTGRPADPPADR